MRPIKATSDTSEEAEGEVTDKNSQEVLPLNDPDRLAAINRAAGGAWTAAPSQGW